MPELIFEERTMEHPPITDTSPKTWIIVGSKRGGTSFLAQVLGENGVKIEHCGNGHNEDLEFVHFNEKILHEAGGDWNDLPSESAIAARIHWHEEELIKLIESKKTNSWGWKDPRQGATVKHFFPYLEDDVYLVCVFRRPDKAAESMHRTWPRHSLSYCRSVINSYYAKILEAIEEFIYREWNDE